ncbi:MAG: dTMP kinase [Gammaproteobacteria bacterium]|nr:dTMP kinase [Gammaproteobacteria bacterium]
MNNNTKEMLRSKFITFEGTEGVGKTTQIELLQEYLQSKKIKTLVTREPGGTKTGERIREILLDKKSTNLDSHAELLLMFAARAQHLDEVIYPALQKNIWVLCDRFTDASYAYQGGGRGVPLSEILKLESVVQGNFQPDLTILLTCDIKTGMQRVARRGKKDRFEKERLEFFEQVQDTYLQRAKDNPLRIRVVNADQAINEVAIAIQTTVNQRFPELLF